MIVIKSRREILRGFVFVMAGIALGTTLHFAHHIQTFSEGKKNVCIIVDAGHGIPDGGAVGAGGTVEQKINLAVADKLSEVLKARGIEVIMTRTDEQSLSENDGKKTIRMMKREDMSKRREIMKKSGADLFLSIHMNCHESSAANGLRLFYDSSHPNIKPLAEDIQQRIGTVSAAKTYTVKAMDRSLFLFKSPPVPCILCECGFLSNPEEEKKLNEPDYQARIAWAAADAICGYYENAE